VDYDLSQVRHVFVVSLMIYTAPEADGRDSHFLCARCRHTLAPLKIMAQEMHKDHTRVPHASSEIALKNNFSQRIKIILLLIFCFHILVGLLF